MSWLPDSVVENLREAITLPDFSATRYEVIGEIGRGGMGAVYVGPWVATRNSTAALR